MKIEIIKDVKWATLPSVPPFVFNKGQILDLEDKLANDLIKHSYAVKIKKEDEEAPDEEAPDEEAPDEEAPDEETLKERKSISGYENKAIKNVPENKTKKKKGTKKS